MHKYTFWAPLLYAIYAIKHNMHLNAKYAKNKDLHLTQRLTFPKLSNTSAASPTDFVLDVRYANVSAVDLVI